MPDLVEARSPLLAPATPSSGLVLANTASTGLRGFVSDLSAIWTYRELLDQLVRKELKVKYKESVLGFFWSMARPMLHSSVR